MSYKDGIFSNDEREELRKAAIDHKEDIVIDKFDREELKTAFEEIKTGKMSFDNKDRELSKEELDRFRPISSKEVDEYLKNNPGVFKN